MEIYPNEYGLPPIATDEFVIKRVSSSYYIYWEPSDGFWKDVATARARNLEWRNERFGTLFEERYRSHFGYKDKTIAQKGMSDFIKTIIEAGKLYVEGEFQIKEGSFVDNQSQA